jgi:protoheme IX farnesyltransferase
MCIRDSFGITYLRLAVNPLTAGLSFLTIIIYLAVYTPLKRVSSINTLVGAVPGAIPPMMGVTAAVGALTAEAWALFLILFIWQMPHFLAIAILYRDDYAAGGFRMLPVVDPDLVSTGRQIVLYGIAMVPVSLLLDRGAVSPVGHASGRGLPVAWAAMRPFG